MAKVTPLPKLKQQREKAGWSRADLATALELPEATVAQWERNPASATPDQLADLAVLLWRPWASATDDSDDGCVYGSLKTRIPGHQLDYPVSRKERSSVLEQLGSLGVGEADDPSDWLVFSTLDNKLVYANTAFVQQVELASDDAEETVNFEHPLVYAALEDWETEGVPMPGPVVRRACERAIAEQDDPCRQASHTRVVSATGEVSWHFMLEAEDTTGYFALDLSSYRPWGPNRFLQVLTEGYHRDRFVNLSTVAVIEVPRGRYLRLLDEDDEATA